MVTACGPLIFLNTSNADAPTGRNVRVQARSASARQLNPPATGPGHFETFAVDAKRGPRTVKRKSRSKGKANEPAASHLVSSRFSRSKRGVEPPSDFPLTMQVQWINGPIIALVKLEDALEIAAFHIRRSTAQIVRSQPENILTALRCRQWSFLPPDIANVGSSPHLDSAIECVVSKVNMIVSGCPYQARSRMLTSYSRALRLLRAAVMESNELSGIRDVFAASQLLAIYEMLDFPQSDSWIQHISGAATIARLHTLEKMGGAGILGHAAPMFVEALVSNDHSFFDSQHWQTLLTFVRVRRYPNIDGVECAIECFSAMREIFAAAHATANDPADADLTEVVTRGLTDDPMPSIKHLALLSRAHELRWNLKRLVLLCERRFFAFGGQRWCARSCDVLGLFLISIMVLDRLIRDLRVSAFSPASSRRSGLHVLRQSPPMAFVDLEEDTIELCTQMIGMELKLAEAHPGRAVLRALVHQNQIFSQSQSQPQPPRTTDAATSIVEKQ